MTRRDSETLLRAVADGAGGPAALVGDLPPAAALTAPPGRLAAWTETTLFKTLVSLGDQAVVSGTSFATTIAVGRWCAQEQLGLYCLGFSLAVMVLTALQSLVTVPYTVYSQRLHGGAQRHYAGGVLLQAGVLGLVTAAAVLGWSGVRYAGWGPQPLSPVLAAVASVMVWIVLREFARRHCMAHLNVFGALGIDASIALVHLSCLGLLAWSGRLSAVTGLLSLGGACAVVVAAWWTVSRGGFTFDRAELLPAWRRNWRMGRWIFAGQMVGNMISDVLLVWLVAAVLGAVQAGVFAAAVTVVNFSNPFLLGMSQVLNPRIARAFARESRRDFRRVVVRSAWVLGGAMALFGLLVFVGGGWAMDFIYRGKYPGCETLASLLAVTAWVHALWICPGMGLCALDRAELNFRAALAGLAVTGVATGVLVTPYGLVGVAGGMLAGQIVVASITWLCFTRFAGGEAPEG